MPRRRREPTGTDPALEPALRALAELPTSATRARTEAASESDRLERILRPRIDGHLLAYEGVLAELVQHHRSVGETIAFGMGDKNRWTAVWEMSGRCLGLCGALLVQLRAGYASETVPTMRCIHEAAQLASVLNGPGEERMLRRWLADEYLGAQQVREAERRIQRRFREQLAAFGIPVGEDFSAAREIYDILSKPAHNVRIGFAESLSVPQLLFVCGPHPYPIQRAVHVCFGGLLLVEVAQRIGLIFAVRFLGNGFYSETIVPIVDSINVLHAAMPIDPQSVRRL